MIHIKKKIRTWLSIYMLILKKFHNNAIPIFSIPCGSNFKIPIFDPLNWFQNPLTNYTLHFETQGPRATQSNRNIMSAVICNFKFASSHSKKKTEKKTSEINFNNIFYLIHYIKLLSFQHVITIENYWASLRYFLQRKSLKSGVDFICTEYFNLD